MAVVLTVRTLAEGHTLGACTAACYDSAENTPCVCVCRGANHGKGRLVAMSSAEEIAATWTGVARVSLAAETAQRILFDARHLGRA